MKTTKTLFERLTTKQKDLLSMEFAKYPSTVDAIILELKGKIYTGGISFGTIVSLWNILRKGETFKVDEAYHLIKKL